MYQITSFIVPTAYILSTSDLRPLILMRILVPFSMTCSPLSVHCGGVAFASKVMSDGIIYAVLVGGYLHEEQAESYITSNESLQRATVHEEARSKNRGDHTIHLEAISLIRILPFFDCITYHLALVRSPYDGFVVNDVFSMTRARQNFAVGYVEGV
mgnify:CR=1 FL=1